MDLEQRVLRIGWPDKYIHHGTSVTTLRTDYGLDDATILQKIEETFKTFLRNQIEDTVQEIR